MKPKAQRSAERRTKSDDFKYGYRYLKVVRPDGTEDTDIVPLREEDLLHPQEDDFVVHNDYHLSDVLYLLAVFRAQTANRHQIRILADHIIDFQHGGVQPLCPDVTVMQGEPLAWDRSKGTFPVADMKSRVLFLVELTSPSTRKKDFGPKFELYYRAGIPLYVIVDAPYGGARKPRGVLVYRPGAKAYEHSDELENGRVWLDGVEVWLGIEEGRAACYDADGRKISAPEEAILKLEQEKARADEANARAEQEKQRADQEKARAEEEKQRADAAIARLRELEAKMKKPKGRKR